MQKLPIYLMMEAEKPTHDDFMSLVHNFYRVWYGHEDKVELIMMMRPPQYAHFLNSLLTRYMFLMPLEGEKPVIEYAGCKLKILKGRLE